MQPETPRVWVRWRLRVRGSTIEVAESSSDSGVATPIDSADERLLDVTDVRLASTFSQFAIGSTAAAQLAAARNSLAGWHDEGIQGQPSVALFVVPPPGLEGFRWDGLSQVIDAIEPGHDAPVVVVTEPTSEFADATSLTLPLRVAIVGDRATEVATTLFANSSWFGRPGLATVDVVTTSDPAAHLPAQHYDVLIVESEARRRRQSVGASLAVVLDAGARKPGDPVAPVTRGPMLAPVGRSTFVFDGFDPGGVNDLLEHLTHDVALHDIAAQLSGSAYLLSTPTAVHDLHIRDLVVDMALSVHESEVTDPTLPALPIDPAEYDSPPLAVRFDRLSFERESGGLFPIWDLMTGSWRSRVIAARGVVPGSSREASVGERVVDITMRRDRAERGATLPFVRPGEGLVADGTYHLRVGIGRPSSFSIMRGEPVSREGSPWSATREDARIR